MGSICDPEAASRAPVPYPTRRENRRRGLVPAAGRQRDEPQAPNAPMSEGLAFELLLSPSGSRRLLRNMQHTLYCGYLAGCCRSRSAGDVNLEGSDTAIQTLGGAGRIGEAEPAVVGDSVQPLQGCDAFRIGIPRVSPWALLSDPFRVPFPRRLFVWDSVQSHQGPRLWTSVPGTPQGSDRRARGETPGNEIRKRRQP